MTSIINTVKYSAVALAMVLFVAMPLAAHAADYGDYGGWDTTGYTDYTDYSNDYGGWDTNGYTDYTDYSNDYGGWDTTGYTDYTQPNYYNDSGYSSGSGFMGGGSYLGGGSFGGSSYLPSSGGNYQTQSQAQVSNNTNTNVNNNIITIGAQNQQTPVCANGYSGTYPNCYQPTPVCQQGFYGTYPNCYRQTYTQPPVYQNPPIAYNNPTPYVSLSAVPYTGLDLGFWGTIAYWGFLILWCLVAAYLVVVKKVQNRILRSLGHFLFGDSVTSREVAVAAPVATAPAVHTYNVPVAQVDAIDPFILAQINRARA